MGAAQTARGAGATPASSATKEKTEKRTPTETQPNPTLTISHDLFKLPMNIRNNCVLSAIDNHLKTIIEKAGSLKSLEAERFDKTIELLNLRYCKE